MPDSASFLSARYPCNNEKREYQGRDEDHPRGGRRVLLSRSAQAKEQLLYKNMQWFLGGLVFKAHRLL